MRLLAFLRLLAFKPNPYVLADLAGNRRARWAYLLRETYPAMWWRRIHCVVCHRIIWPWQDAFWYRHHECRHVAGRAWMDRGIAALGPFVEGTYRSWFRCPVCDWEYRG